MEKSELESKISYWVWLYAFGPGYIRKENMEIFEEFLIENMWVLLEEERKKSYEEGYLVNNKELLDKLSKE